MAQVVPPSTCYILYDVTLNSIIAVFTSQELIDNAIRQLVRDDLEIIRNHIEERMVIDELYQDKFMDMGILQQINYILEKPRERLLHIPIDYHRKIVQERYRKYTKELNMFDLKYKNNSAIIVLPDTKQLS
jgi:hypothetical protein